ncbi:TPA: hypothetical protein ACGFAK_003047 [Serratia marcescens]|uniref:hypothetical protein n=1 Tax=Serratia marcescens TaxID=615 RepID=UPI0029E7B9D3|nr:hypothetical protein [Serratia marcescens]
MTVKIIGKTVDLRSGAHVVYCQATLDEYLNIVGSDFGKFHIQRKRESHKAYKRLKTDISEGALLPSITLAVKPHLVEEITEIIADDDRLSERLSQENTVDILDGLQRTYIISDLKSEGVEFNHKQELLLEFWLESDISKLIYRMIVLNSGQKAMSMRHQVELLFMSLQGTIVKSVDGIEIIRESEQKRRTQPSKYPLNNIASSYHAFVSGSHETDKENLVAQRLIDEDAFDSSEKELTEKFNEYLHYLNRFYHLDQICWAKYSSFDYEGKISALEENEGLSSEEKEEMIKEYNIIKDSSVWLGSENVMLSFFSAISQYIGLDRKDRVNSSLERLIESAGNPDIVDPLGMINFTKVRSGLNPRKTNIGFATRKLISTGFKEFFREEGAVSLSECWPLSAE